MRYLLFPILLVMLITSPVDAQIKQYYGIDSLCGHPFMLDANHHILGWYKPEIPGASYTEVVKRAAELLLNVPADSASGEKLYFISSCFNWHLLRKGAEVVPEKLYAKAWPHNPADTYADMVESLADRYYAYSGQRVFVDLVRSMLEYQLDHGTTPGDWIWPKVPFASSAPFKKDYNGGENGIGDGTDVIQPDKVGKLGYAYLRFYEITEDSRFLDAALHCANALSDQMVQKFKSDSVFNDLPKTVVPSPWPYRINARTGEVVSEYCSNVVDPIKLFDELLRIKEYIRLDQKLYEKYKRTRDITYKWLYSIGGPMKTFIWNAFFEDIGNDPNLVNRNQITPLEWAKYITAYPEIDSRLDNNVPALLHWVKSVFGDEKYDAIKEQTWCYAPMGSHSARYAAACALWFEKTGDPYYKEEAYRHFNYATYMTYNNGVVEVGPGWKEGWWTDGYGDYIQHFLDGIAAIPEWAPANENHLLRSTSIVQNIHYDVLEISYKTYLPVSTEVLRLVSFPKRITVNGIELTRKDDLKSDGWTWKKLGGGGVLRICHSSGQKVKISL